jgi:hypothetical protein
MKLTTLFALLGALFVPAAADAQSYAAPVYEVPSTLVSTSSVAVVPASANGQRVRATLYNTATTGTAWCRVDGGAAVVGTGEPLPPNLGGFQWNYGSAGVAAITCVCSAVLACAISGEYAQ